MRVGSVCSGVGGLDLALESAGFEVAWHAEIDPYASKVLAKRWPGVPNVGDWTAIPLGTLRRAADGVSCEMPGLLLHLLTQLSLQHHQLWHAERADQASHTLKVVRRYAEMGCGVICKSVQPQSNHKHIRRK